MALVGQVLYEETSRNPFTATVRLTEGGLVSGRTSTPVAQLNLVATAEAFLRDRWLGGGGWNGRWRSSAPGARGCR
ncbi:hypothetical protein [Streptomyces sp. SBT349]|uniref:hypothetical protein n=1 Tax=Streptomyces sp. SBT349 TaxID=1580539 RepID=UPI00069F7D61|nr:hypothetical protein [Streptomyces sp. SBT349]